MATVTPTTSSLTPQQAMAFYQGDVSNSPEYANYFTQYGDPSDQQSWWVNPQGQVTPEAMQWFAKAQAGGNQAASEQAAQDKGGMFGKLGPLLLMGALAFGLPAVLGGAGAGAGAAGAGAEAAFGGGMASELAWGAPELAGMAAGGSGLTAGGLAGELAWGAPELAGMAAGNFAPTAAAGATGFFSNLLSNPVGTLTQGVKSLLPGTTGGTSTVGSTGGSTGAMPWDTITSAGSILTGLMGMNERKKLQQTGMQAAQMQDPFGAQRPQYQQMLAQLMADPSSITSRPGFDAGRLAVERSMAAQGYSPARSKVSGNFLDAMSNYGGNFYNQELARLMTLSGAGIGPSGGNLALTGQMAGTQVAGNSIQSIIAGLKGLMT